MLLLNVDAESVVCARLMWWCHGSWIRRPPRMSREIAAFGLGNLSIIPFDQHSTRQPCSQSKTSIRTMGLWGLYCCHDDRLGRKWSWWWNYCESTMKHSENRLETGSCCFGAPAKPQPSTPGPWSGTQ